MLLDADGGVGVEEGDDNASEGLERGPGVDGGGLVDDVAQVGEVGDVEDFGLLEVGDEEGVRGRGGGDEWREVGKVETQWR